MRTDDARAAVRDALHRVVPDVDIADVSEDADLRDALELDSLDFLAFVENLSKGAGTRIDEDDYPRLDTVNHAVAFLTATA